MKEKSLVNTPIGTLFVSLFLLASCQLNPLTELPPTPNLPEDGSQPPSSPVSPPSFSSCKSEDPEFQCIGLKIVSYEEQPTHTVLDEIKAQIMVEEINKIWSSCKIGFQLETYESINPTSLGLNYNLDWRTQASQVRSTFSENDTFLIVATGQLTSSTIAVTQMPGYAPFGVLVEDAFADNPLTVGHELGHYMGLYHFRNTTNLMNPYIGSNTKGITANQCEIARSTNLKYWPQMFR